MDDKAQVRNVCRGETDLMNHLTAHIQQNQGVQHGQDCQQILQHEANSQQILLNKSDNQQILQNKSDSQKILKVRDYGVLSARTDQLASRSCNTSQQRSVKQIKKSEDLNKN